MTEKQRVLILCTGNSARSQMAEGILRALNGEEYDVESAGVEPSRVRPEAIAAMREIGIDISSHHSKSVDEFVGQHFDYVITVCDDADRNCPVFTGRVKHRLHIGFADPARATGSQEEVLAAFRTVRDQIQARFSQLYDSTAKPRPRA